MDAAEFRKAGHALIDYLADYIENISQRPVTPVISKECLKSNFPSTAPEKAESTEKIMEEVEKYIMPGLVHWQHPGYHAGNHSTGSFPATLATMFANIAGQVSYEWSMDPSGSELETIVLDWYGKMMGLPEDFLRYSTGSRGGAAIYKSTDECIFVSLITARRNIMKQLIHNNPSMSTAVFLASLVAYGSMECFMFLEKDAILSQVTLKILESHNQCCLRSKTFAQAVRKDKKIGLIPFFVCVTLNTHCGSCDPIDEIAAICEQYGIWLSIDATYGGNALICPEYKNLLKGFKYASSITVTPAKWLLVHLDCSVLFVKDRFKVTESMIIDKTEYGYSFVEMDWGYPTKSEFRALKLWFVMRAYGAEGLRRHVRNHIRLAKIFEAYVKKDDRFEVLTCEFGIVCFRLKDSDEKNKTLLAAINSTGKILLGPLYFNEKYSIRFILCTEAANENDITNAWNIICEYTEKLFRGEKLEIKSSCSHLSLYPYNYNLP